MVEYAHLLQSGFKRPGALLAQKPWLFVEDIGNQAVERIYRVRTQSG